MLETVELPRNVPMFSHPKILKYAECSKKNPESIQHLHLYINFMIFSPKNSRESLASQPRSGLLSTPVLGEELQSLTSTTRSCASVWEAQWEMAKVDLVGGLEHDLYFP